jgi:peptidoglycan/xylan/chitin deacetylase (PgdA/CDA1 family)
MTKLVLRHNRFDLPQNLLVSAGTVFEDFEGGVAGDPWTKAGDTGYAVAANTTEGEFLTGTQSIKMTAPAWGSARMTRTISLATAGAAPRLRVYFYCHTLPDYTSKTTTQVYLSSTTNPLTKGFYAKILVFPTLGWNVFEIAPTSWVAVSDDSWDNTMIRLLIRVTAIGGECSLSFDEILINTRMSPAVMFDCDDGWAGQKTVAYDYMHAKGLNGTVYMITNNIDGVGYCTTAQLQEMNAGGWSIGNHTTDHTQLAGISKADAITKIADAKIALDALGLTKASMHLAYPYGSYDEDVRLAAVDAGMLTGRQYAEVYPAHCPSCLAYQNFQFMSTLILDSSLTLVAAKAVIDSAYTTGEIVSILGHWFAETAGVTRWSISDFQALIDYIVAKNMPFLTINDYYDAQSGAITIRK